MIRDITKEDESWIKPLFEKNSYILGPFGGVWAFFWQSTAKNEKWVCIEGIGFAHFRRKRNGIVTLYEIAVDENHKRKGYGKKLMDHMGYPMELKTDKDNEESNAFYKKLGFLLMGEKVSKKGNKTFNYWMK